VLTLTDDFSHFVVVYLLSSKVEVFQRFKESMATAHFGLPISRVRSDNGTEFLSAEFVQYFKSKGILLETTIR